MVGRLRHQERCPSKVLRPPCAQPRKKGRNPPKLMRFRRRCATLRRSIKYVRLSSLTRAQDGLSPHGWPSSSPRALSVEGAAAAVRATSQKRPKSPEVDALSSTMRNFAALYQVRQAFQPDTSARRLVTIRLAVFVTKSVVRRRCCGRRARNLAKKAEIPRS